MSKKIDLSKKDSLFFSLSSELFDFSRIAITFTFFPLMIAFFQSEVIIFAIIFALFFFFRYLSFYASKMVKSRKAMKNSFFTFLFLTTLSLYWLYFIDLSTNLLGLIIGLCFFSFSSSMVLKTKTIILSSFFKLKVRYFSHYRLWRWRWVISPVILMVFFLLFSSFSTELMYNAIILTFSIILSFSSFLVFFINFYKLKKPELEAKEEYQTVYTPRERGKDETVPSFTIRLLYNFAYGTFTPLILYHFKVTVTFSDIHLCILVAIGALIASYSTDLSYILIDFVKNPLSLVLIVSILLISFSTSFLFFSNLILISIGYVLWRGTYSVFSNIVRNIIVAFPFNDDLKKFAVNPYITDISLLLGILSSGVIYLFHLSIAFISTSIVFLLITVLLLIGLRLSPLTDYSSKVREERSTGEW